MVLSDNETKVDLLNYEAIAKTIANLLRQRPDHPITIGVHGDWGAGKSSILEMIEAELEEQEKVLCLKFNGWRFQGFEDAKIALIEGIVTGLLDKRPDLTKATDAVKNIFERIDWLKVAKKVGGLAITAHTGIPLPGQVETIVHALKALIPSGEKTKEGHGSVEKKNTEGILKPEPQNGRVPKEIQAFRLAFDQLLTAADVKQTRSSY